MKKLFAFIIILITFNMLLTLTACDPEFNTLICQNGVIKLVADDNTSGSEVMSSSDYWCGIHLSNEADYNQAKHIYHAVNGSFQPIDEYTYSSTKNDYTIPRQCSWLPSPHRSNFDESVDKQCIYEDCPNCVVVYCDSKDQITLSEQTCADFKQNGYQE